MGSSWLVISTNVLSALWCNLHPIYNSCECCIWDFQRFSVVEVQFNVLWITRVFFQIFVSSPEIQNWRINTSIVKILSKLSQTHKVLSRPYCFIATGLFGFFTEKFRIDLWSLWSCLITMILCSKNSPWAVDEKPSSHQEFHLVWLNSLNPFAVAPYWYHAIPTCMAVLVWLWSWPSLG